MISESCPHGPEPAACPWCEEERERRRQLPVLPEDIHRTPRMPEVLRG